MCSKLYRRLPSSPAWFRRLADVSQAPFSYPEIGREGMVLDRPRAWRQGRLPCRHARAGLGFV